jgi:hypothetical protein
LTKEARVKTKNTSKKRKMNESKKAIYKKQVSKRKYIEKEKKE